jgi:NDP-mannose synthase
MNQRLVEVFKGLLATTPYVGPGFSEILRGLDKRDLIALIETLRCEIEGQTSELKTQLELNNAQLSKLLESIEAWRAQSPGEGERMTVVIPTGGLGISMAPLTYVMPKCLVTVGDRPLLQRIIDSFLDRNSRQPLRIIKKVIVLTQSFHSAIAESVRQAGYGTFVECRQIKKAVPAALLELRDELAQGPFLVHYCDILIPQIDWIEVYDCYKRYRNKPAVIGMLICSRHYPLGIGVIIEQSRIPHLVHSFQEKPDHLTGGLANLGVAVFHPEVFGYLRDEHQGIFEDTMEAVLAAHQRVGSFEVGEWEHIHELKDLIKAQRDRGQLPEANVTD